MQGREYLDLAKEIFAGATEVHWRGATGRAYYALMLECREALFRWGFQMTTGQNAHTFVRLRFSYPASKDLKLIGDKLEELSRWRNRADYVLNPLPFFTTDKIAQLGIQGAEMALALLDAIDADPNRRAAAIVAIRAAFP